MNQSQNNRVSFSFGMKLPLQEKYSSADFHVSLTSDVNPGETNQQALDRVRNEVTKYARKTYDQIHNSDSGVLELEEVNVVESEPTNEKNEKKARSTSAAPGSTPTVPEKPKEGKIVRMLIKQAFGVLESQKKVTKPDFVQKYLNNKKTDELNDTEALGVIELLNKNFPELKL